MKHYHQTLLSFTAMVLIGTIALAAGPERKSRSAQSPPHSPSKMIKRASSQPFSLPVCIEPTEEQFGNIEILDANGDGKTWKRQVYGTGYFKYDYHSNNAADDWAFIPVQMEGEDNFVTLTVESRVQDANYKESFEMAWGTSPDPASMNVVLEVNKINNTSWATNTTSFSINKSGTVYIGLHATSDKDLYGVWVRNISLSALTTPLPLAPSITSSSIDGLEYSAQIKMPESTVQGKPITDALALVVDVDGTEVKRVNATAGETVDVSLTLEKGTHIITYTAVLTDGENNTQTSDSVRDSVRASSDEPVTLPLLIQPTEDEFNEICFVIDGNSDGNTWEYSSSESALQYYYSSSNAADEWFFLPPIDFGAKGGAFDLSLEAKVASAYSPESFEVCVGRTASTGDMIPMLSCENIKNTIWDTYDGKITIPEGGKWYVAVHATSPADQYSLYVRNISITGAADNTPAIPKVKTIDFNGTAGTITYILPDVTVENKELTMPVGLIVNVDGNEFTRTDPAAAGSDVEIPMTLSLGKHSITAQAFITVNEEILTGSPVVSQILITNPEGYVYELPFEMRPTAGEFDILTRLDANGSGIDWEYNSGADNGKGALMCRTKNDKASDAWIFFPKVAITDASVIYNVSAQVRAYLEQFPEDFDICIGKEATPQSMTVVASCDNYNSYLYNEVKGEYIAPAPGEYIIGIHRRSGADAHTLSVHSIGIAESGKSTMAPAEATDLEAKADPTGVAAATISFNMPAVSISGVALDSNEELTATVSSGNGGSATVSGKPGERVSVRVAGPEGFSTFTVVVASPTYGNGNPATVTAYCGFDKPLAPTVSCKGSIDNMSLTVTWEDQTIGEHGGAVNTATLAHNIYVPADSSGEYWTLVAELPAGETSYLYSVENYALQDIAYIGVVAINDKGSSSLGLTYDVLGTPYPLPMGDDFNTGRYLYTPLITPTPTDEYCPDWFFDDPGLLIPSLAGQKLNALFCANTVESDYKHALLTLPKFTTVGAPAVKLSLDLYSASTTPEITILADTYSEKNIVISTIDAKSGNDWHLYELNLPEKLLGQQWVAISIRANFGNGSEAIILKDYEIHSVFEKELQTELQMPSEMIVGDTYEAIAFVTNRAETDATIPEIVCTIGDKKLEPRTIPDTSTIKAGETLQYVYSITPVTEMIGTATATFKLENYTDQMPENNVAEVDVNIIKGNKPIVTDLKGELTPEGVATLVWTEPELKLTGNDDVEEYESFDYSQNIGGWLNIDRDGKDVYGLGNGVSFPGQFEPKAFQVMDTDKMPSGVAISAYSGSKYFLAITPEQGAADDWLISPEVKGGSKVSFRLNILSEEYGAESVDIMYSTTGRNHEDFTLLKTFSQARIAWNPLEVTLPADARYFAFHYRCDDIFGICLDDIFYSPVTDHQIAGYNVYRNGDLITERHDKTVYEIKDSKSGDKFNVAAVTEINGQYTVHPMSNTYVYDGSAVNTIINTSSVTGHNGYLTINGHAGKSASIYTTDGLRAAYVENMDDSQNIALAAGIYLVKISDNIAPVKVIVK